MLIDAWPRDQKDNPQDPKAFAAIAPARSSLSENLANHHGRSRNFTFPETQAVC
jgi:hypothetical protein